MRRFVSLRLACGALLSVLAANSPTFAMGKVPPPDAVAQQLAEYRSVLVAYFKAFNLLPIVFPAGQKPGDVFDMRQKGVLKSTAEECFPGLVQPAPVSSALAYTFQLDSSKAGFALGLQALGSVDFSSDFEQAATVSFTDVKVVTVSQQSLSAAVSKSCKEVAAVVAQAEVPFQASAPAPPLLAVIGTLVTAKRQIFIGAKQNLDVKASVDKLSTVLATTGIGATLKVTGLDPSLSVALGFGGKRGVLVQSDQELPVAFMPAFIPEVLFSTVQGGSEPPKPRSLAWRSFDPAATDSTKILDALVDAAHTK